MKYQNTQSLKNSNRCKISTIIKNNFFTIFLLFLSSMIFPSDIYAINATITDINNEVFKVNDFEFLCSTTEWFGPNVNVALKKFRIVYTKKEQYIKYDEIIEVPFKDLKEIEIQSEFNEFKNRKYPYTYTFTMKNGYKLILYKADPFETSSTNDNINYIRKIDSNGKIVEENKFLDYQFKAENFQDSWRICQNFIGKASTKSNKTGYFTIHIDKVKKIVFNQ